MGSITSLTNGSGQLAASYVYDSFGNLTASTGTITNPFQYTGREFDPETGLYYYRARYYDPVSGRFLSEDPIGFAGGINFYAYVRNNPVGLRDPKGLCVDQDKLKNCISSLFGVATLFFTPSTPDANGSFTGEMAGIYNGAYQPLLPGPYEFTVTNNTGLTVSSVTALYNLEPGSVQVPPGTPIGGFTPQNSPFINFTGGNQTPAAILQTQIFELGNSLGFITGKQLPPQGTPWNVTPGPEDNEPGTPLLNCYNAQ